MAITETVIRQTRQRQRILTLLDDTERFLTPQQLHAALCERGARIGLSTVYRTLQLLVNAGEVDTLRLPEGVHVFRRCAQRRHHHLVCRGCGSTVEVSARELEPWIDQVAVQHNFTDVNHSLLLLGWCSRCAPAEAGTQT